jgi:hypothetical protein
MDAPPPPPSMPTDTCLVTQTAEFNNTRGDVDNPLCVVDGGVCGTSGDAGPFLGCCAGWACKCPGGDQCVCS